MLLRLLITLQTLRINTITILQTFFVLKYSRIYVQSAKAKAFRWSVNVKLKVHKCGQCLIYC